MPTLRESLAAIDLILLDLMMPGMSGMEVLEQVQALDDTLPVIIITGYATVESAVEAMKKGAYDFIAKPFTPDQLRIVVKRAQERRTLQREAEFLRSERERSLRDVATEKSRVNTIINCMGDGILVCDRESCIVLANPAAGRLLQLPESLLRDRSASQGILPPELAKTIEASLRAEDGATTSITQELVVGEGQELFLRAHTAPVMNDRDEIMGSVTVLQDISHLKELDKMKSEFIAMVAHELRAPIATVEQQLAVILGGMAGEMNEQQRPPDRPRQGADAGGPDPDQGSARPFQDRSGDDGPVQGTRQPRRRDLPRGRTDDGGGPAEEYPDRIRAAVSRCRASGRPEQHGGRLCQSSFQCRQIHARGGKVTIGLDDEGGYVKVTVTDTGIGIKSEDHPADLR